MHDNAYDINCIAYFITFWCCDYLLSCRTHPSSLNFISDGAICNFGEIKPTSGPTSDPGPIRLAIWLGLLDDMFCWPIEASAPGFSSVDSKSKHWQCSLFVFVDCMGWIFLYRRTPTYGMAVISLKSQFCFFVIPPCLGWKLCMENLRWLILHDNWYL